MKKLVGILVLIITLLTSCQQSTDPIVAQVYQHKLYASEVRALLPAGLPATDSTAFANQVIDDWIQEQLLLTEAEQQLSMREKNFQKEMSTYRNSLLCNKLLEKLSTDTARFYVTDDEVRATLPQARSNFVTEKEIVRINYVKVPLHSPIKERVKSILFQEDKRLLQKDELVQLCADSMEYFLDDEAWLFWEDVQLEVDIDLPHHQLFSEPECVEKNTQDACYLMVILDYKSEQTGEDSKSYFESVRTLLIQKKKTDYLNQHLKELYLRAENAGKIAR